MVKKVNSDTTAGTLAIDLFGLGMTVLHKVGLAGLWMTLKAIDRDAVAKNRFEAIGASWKLEPTRVTLNWKGNWKQFFDVLFNESFKTDKNGLIWFPALGEPLANRQHAVVLQEAMLNTILQHGQSRLAEKGQGSGVITVEIDDTPLTLRYRKLNRYNHQDVRSFSASGKNSIAGWLFPGGAIRHQGLGQDASMLEESPERALALRYLCAGAVYFEIHKRGGSVKPRYALVLPDVLDCEMYSRARSIFVKYGVQKLKASGSAEAGFRILASLKAADLLPQVRSAFCRVISFGIVPWSTQQKSRVQIAHVKPGSENAFIIFERCIQFFRPRLVIPKAPTQKQPVRLRTKPLPEPFWSIPQIPDLVAQNLASHQPWWHNFTEFVVDTDCGDHIFKYEREGLQQMVENQETLPDGPERTFVIACHEAWRRRLGALGERTRSEGTSFVDKANKEFDKTRVAFSRCKTAATFREVISDFWSCTGSLPALQEGWREILPLLSEEQWKKGKDLALLALASYKPLTEEEKAVLQSNYKSEHKGK